MRKRVRAPHWIAVKSLHTRCSPATTLCVAYRRWAVKRSGQLDAVVVNHAHSQMGTLHELDAATLDLTRAVNVRASPLLVRAFAKQYQPGPPASSRFS